MPTAQELKLRLEKKIERLRTPEEKAKIMLKYCFDFISRDTNLVWELVNRALQISEKHKYLFGIKHSYKVLGQYYKATSNFDKAIASLNKGLELNHGVSDSSFNAVCLMYLADVYGATGKSEQSVEAYENSLTIFQSLDNMNGKQGAICCLINLGDTFVVKKQYTKALSYFQRSEDLAHNIDAKALIYESRTRIGTVLRIHQRYDEAIELLETCRQYFEDSGHKRDLSTVYNELGGCLFEIGRYKEAFEYLKRSLEIDHQFGLKENEVVVNLNIARCYIRVGNIPDAMKYLAQGNEIGLDIGFDKTKTMISNAFSLLAESLSEIVAQSHEDRQMLRTMSKELEKLTKADSQENRSNTTKLKNIKSNIDEQLTAKIRDRDTIHLQVSDTWRKRFSTSFPRLTEAELTVCTLLKLFPTIKNKEIAEKMNVGTGSVQTYRRRVIKKIGLRSGERLHTFIANF